MAKRVHLNFTRPEDLRLVAWMEKQAYKCRYDLATFIVVGLHDAFDHQLPPDEPEVPKENFEHDVYYHGKAPIEPHGFIYDNPIGSTLEPSLTMEKVVLTKPVFSDEQLARDAEAEIARLDAIAASAMGKRKRTGKIPLPPPV